MKLLKDELQIVLRRLKVGNLAFAQLFYLHDIVKILHYI